MRYRVTINQRTGETVQYVINRRSHNHESVDAAIEGLNTFAKHGHSDFPRNDRALVITVEEDPAP